VPLVIVALSSMHACSDSDDAPLILTIKDGTPCKM